MAHDSRAASAGRTSRRPATDRSPTAWRTRPAGRSTCCSPTRVAEHIPGLQHGVPPGRAAGAVGGFDPRYPHRGRRRRRRAGGSRNAAARIGFHPGRHGVAPPPQLGAHVLAAAARLRHAPRRCSSANGRRSTTCSGHLSWAGRLYGQGLTAALRARAGRRLPAAPGARRRSSRCTSPARVGSRRCR